MPTDMKLTCARIKRTATFEFSPCEVQNDLHLFGLAFDPSDGAWSITLGDILRTWIIFLFGGVSCQKKNIKKKGTHNLN